MQWSVYFQNPEFLEYTRLFLIQPELKPLVRAWCGIRDGMKILEKTLSTLIQTNETKKSTQIDAFFESKPKIDANAQRQEYKMAS